MHVPKTSGTAINSGLGEALNPLPWVAGFDRSIFGAFDAFDSMQVGLRATIHLDLFPPAEVPDLVSGHFSYSTITRSRPQAQLMTVLREPRARILSHWMFWRAQSDQNLQGWGGWSEIVRLARLPLLQFLNRGEVACQVDNATVRMLLWPHPLIPDDGFIHVSSDERLIIEAAARLKRFAFADVIENPRFKANLQSWIGRPFTYARVNETNDVPPELRVPLRDELTPEVLRLIEHRSRLDRVLWLALACDHIVETDAKTLSNDVFLRTVARHAALMAAPQPGLMPDATTASAVS